MQLRFLSQSGISGFEGKLRFVVYVVEILGKRYNKL